VRISEDARQHVVFFGIASPPKGEIAYGGTGFLVGIQGRDGQPHPYIVTCRHVAKALEAAGGFVIRANLNGGGSHSLAVEESEWAYHPDPSVDLAAAIFWLDGRVFDHAFFDIEKSMARAGEHGSLVRCGDIASIVGLFRLHHGKQRNIAIVHTGHVAALPDPNEPLPSRDRLTGAVIETEGYLVEAQTLEGLSGSPVFVRQTANLSNIPMPDGRIAEIRADDGSTLTLFAGVRFLGIYQGAWDGEPGEILAADRNLRGGLRVPVGMGIVVPGEKIIELLKGDPKLKEHRERVEKEAAAAGAAKNDPAFPALPASDEPPASRGFHASCRRGSEKT
jgi:hypothetical protein